MRTRFWHGQVKRMSDGKVVFEIKGDPKGINTTLKDVTANIEKESKKWDDAADQSTGNIEGMFSGMLKGIVGAFSAAGIAKLILDWGKASIAAASDLAEVQNVVDVTFGESSKKIEAWAQTAGKQFGLTETQAKKYTSTIGAMMKSQGIAGDNILSMSTDLAGLAADMASFYNLDFDTAFDKIRSGIFGETMPLKQLGINMSVANLEAFALEQGITKSYTAMSQGEQTLLRYQYLMKATADAQGDFARTSDQFANASRRVQTSWETIKTKGGELLMYVVEPLTTGLADLLDMITEQPERTVLDDFADIDKDYMSRMAHLNDTYNRAESILGVMNEIKAMSATVNGQSISFEQLFADIANVEQNGGNIREYISGLGLDADFIVQKYQVWQESTKQLTSSIPALTSVIDAETGAIDGSTEAIQDNLDKWKAAEEEKLEWTAYYAKARALEEKKGEMYRYELEAGVATRMRERFEREHPEFMFDYQNYLDTSNPFFVNWFGDEFKEYSKLREDEAKALENLENQTADYSDAETELAEAKNYLIDKYGEEADAADYAGESVKDYGNKSADAWQTATDGAKDAIKALADYVQSVHDATEATVNGIVKGFQTLERPTTALEEKRDKLIEQQNELNRSTKDGEKRYQELQKQIDELNKSMDEYSPKGMQDALQSQITFMDEYIKNLEKAREMGLSNELLASLSDGSVQSAEYLSQLVASPEQAKEVDALYQQVQEKKKGFTDVLTEQKLTVDQTYDAMVEKAKTAIGELNLGEEAQDAMGETVAGLAQGISDHVPDVKDAVDALITQLDRLNGYGINISLGSFGSLFTDGSNLIDGEHETGLDYVPFDGYLAGLHEGEGILTAEENRIWQRFKNGAQPQTMDYDALGATMRDNIQPGGDVYLNGRIVGQVVSQQQGNSYRSLQRSGFQA